MGEAATQNVPMRLSDACEQYFAGAITPATLRTEARKGNLAMLRIAGKDFVTPSALEEMIARCRVESYRPASHSEQIGRPMKNEPSASSARSGSSETETVMSAQDALRAKLRKRQSISPTTSRRSETPSSETASLLSFPSQTS